MTAFMRAPRGSIHRRLAFVGAVTAGGLLLAGCGGDGDTKGADHTGAKESATSGATASSTAGTGAFNAADVTFAQMMIPHHQQALEMARLADGQASNARIKSLAGRIEKAQDPEIVTLKSWLKGWGRPEKAPSSEMPGMHHDAGGKGTMEGMMSEEDMRKLKAAKGPAFDRAFASMMIDHHKGAIAMAKDEKKNGRNAKAKKLADDVVKNQSSEVATLRTLLHRL
ncbi:DUF305 domain-containing protein [Streptomyces antioxidans]|uniref:DUF305 domain-containing protein n=1 Tax=Streptomyces antioxidans TaxID=1507734 RepID=A0A1V4D3U4_9ACTN|nr:DUF305 domain-containing protein [Streptomyces antioxidans]OPF78831.1 DUF305 domain-containing protein [Streptomyces antioxidans]